MSSDYRDSAPAVLRDFLTYHETIRGHSRKTVDEYFLDLRTLFRYLKIRRKLIPRDTQYNEIPISDVDLGFVASVTLEEVYGFLSYLSRDREKKNTPGGAARGLSATARARKIASIRSFYKYLTFKAKLLSENPVADLDSPKAQKTLPRYLSLDESKKLLSAVSGQNKLRDYCILCIFLNCGLRISELCGLNIGDVKEDHLRVIGKGDKERIVYLNSSTRAAIDDYLIVRRAAATAEKDALFLSVRRKRLGREMVHKMVKNSLLKAGLQTEKFSAHKLRHTAATLMLQNGVDVRTLQEVLGHEHLNTTQIYTHVDNTELHIAADANPLADFKPNK